MLLQSNIGMHLCANGIAEASASNRKVDTCLAQQKFRKPMLVSNVESRFVSTAEIVVLLTSYSMLCKLRQLHMRSKDGSARIVRFSRGCVSPV